MATSKIKPEWEANRIRFAHPNDNNIHTDSALSKILYDMTNGIGNNSQLVYINVDSKNNMTITQVLDRTSITLILFYEPSAWTNHISFFGVTGGAANYSGSIFVTSSSTYSVDIVYRDTWSKIYPAS